MTIKTLTSGTEINVEVTEVTIPAGTYFVGDPCYAVPQDRWAEWLEAAGLSEDNADVLVADLDGHPVVGLGTAYGDGEYEGSDGNLYPVDAGLLGVVAKELRPDVAEIPGMRLMTFDRPTTLIREGDHKGIIHFGWNLTIDTEEQAEDYDEFADEEL